MLTVECDKCGLNLLVTPNLSEVTRSIQNHAAKCPKVYTTFQRINLENRLIELVFKNIAELQP